VATDHSAATPWRGGRRQWLASAVLATCAALVTLALVLGPYSHARGRGHGERAGHGRGHRRVVVAHTLAVITFQAGVGRRLAGRHPEQATSALESIETIGRTAQVELHAVLGLLRAAGTPVDLQLSWTDRPLSPALEL
jgi:Histidine kinase